MKKRYDLIDTLRGLAIISMIGFHACWIMNYFGILITSETLYGTIFTVWEKSICIPFITIAGFSFSLGHNHLRSGLIVFGWGLIITAVTCIFLYDIRIVFGVLTLIGSSILLTIPIDNVLRNHNLLTKKTSVLLFAVSFLLFLLTYKINIGYLGFYPAFCVKIPRSIYNGYIATYFGFMDPGFYSTDYFSLFPWWFLYLTGYFLHKITISSEKAKSLLENGIPGIRIIGRYSLPIYLIHPIIIFILLFFITRFL